jgi:GNAT superfamily N-acetyltransferase
VCVLEGDARRERPLPRGIHLRRGRAEDEFATFEVMRRTMGYDTSWTREAAVRQHLRTVAQSSFWVAEETPRFGSVKIIGYARSVVNDRVWRLTEFFVLPGNHRQGIGGALLARSLEDGRRDGADTTLILASHHPAAAALYIRRAGCIPRLPMLLLSGPLASLRAFGPDAAPIEDAFLPPFSHLPKENRPALHAEPLILTPDVQAGLDALDREIVGYARPREQAYWTAAMGGPNGASRLFRRASGGQQRGAVVGYAYLGDHASGPALATEPVLLPSLIAHVAAVARSLSRADNFLGLSEPTDQYLAVAGSNETVLRWLLDCGWQIIFQYQFMSSRPLGRLDRYVGHNPLYFL